MGRAVSRRAPRRVNERPSAAKLQLAEFLLLSESAVECARHAANWLVTSAGARFALCAALDDNRSRLVGLAQEGLRSFDPASFSVNVDHSRHHLVMALGRTQPLILSAGEPIDGLRLPDGSYAVFPLHGLRLDEDV